MAVGVRVRVRVRMEPHLVPLALGADAREGAHLLDGHGG